MLVFFTGYYSGNLTLDGVTDQSESSIPQGCVIKYNSAILFGATN